MLKEIKTLRNKRNKRNKRKQYMKEIEYQQRYVTKRNKKLIVKNITELRHFLEGFNTDSSKQKKG